MRAVPRVLKITRRQVLAASAVAAGLGAVGTSARVASWWHRDPEAPYDHLDAREAALVDSIADAIFPPGGTPAIGGKEAGATAWFDTILAGTPEPTRGQLRLLLHALDDWCRCTSGHGFCELSLDDRITRMRGWATSDNHLLRGAIQSLTIFVSAGYCLHPEVKAATGWIFPCGFAP